MSKKSSSVKAVEKQEQNDFLLRSLDRNDVEIAALIDLHRTIHAVKQAIIRNCGEETLLDLGEGKLKLAPSSDSLQVADGIDLELPPQESQHLCVDFLLRMKLRRKLMNRLARRLLRVAHCMDGNELQPPPVPKYGEQRLHLDPERIKAFSEHLLNREMAIRTIESARSLIYNKEAKAKVSGETVEERSPTGNADGTAPEHVSSTDATKDSHEQPEANENEKTSTEPAASLENAAPKEEAEPNMPQPDAETSMADSGNDSLPTEGSAEGGTTNPVTGSAEEVMEACYHMLTDYKDVYEKLVDPETGAVVYPALEGERETSLTNTSTGIGATNSSMSVKEKEAEDQKWQAALLSRIPDQPTFEELGLDNRVFNLKARRKRVLKKKNAEANKRAKMGRSGADNENVTSDDDDDDLEEDEEEESKNSDSRDNGNEESDEEKVGEVENSSDDSKEKNEVVQVRIKPISLLPVPSFYDQDLKRVKLIHHDLMMSSLQDQARGRLEGVTKDYNKALAKSNELYDRHYKIQEELNTRRRNNAMMRSQFEMHSKTLKDTWFAKLKVFNDRKLNAVLPSRHGHPLTGTFAIQQYGQRDAFALEVSNCLADVVDGVDKIVQGMVPNEKFTETLALPALPPEFEQSINYENMLVQQGQTLMQSLRTSEEERHRCWKKMMKTKAEFEMGSGARNPDASRYAMMPPPQLRATAPQLLPQQVHRPVLSTYKPKARIIRQTKPAASSSASESKYSAARIRERISDDGTVAPVSEPKKTKDGLFLRPAGRTRKGMDWDAVRGIWVPFKEE